MFSRKTKIFFVKVSVFLLNIFIPRNGKDVCCSGYKRNKTTGLCDSMYDPKLIIKNIK